MNEKARNNLKESFHKEYAGVRNSGKTIVLEEGCKFNKTSIPPEEAQFLETRQFAVPEICRWFRMPPNKVADMTRAQGWSTLEQTNTDYVTDTLMPWFVRWEQEIYRKLLTKDEKKQGIFVRHLANALLRGDIAARTTSYTAGRNGGWFCADDIREMEDLNPLPDGKGQIYLQPLNMVEAGTEPETQQSFEPIPQEPEQKKEDDTASKAVMFNVIMPKTEIEKTVDAKTIAFADDCAERISSAEIREIEKHISKSEDKEGFNKWLNEFYEKHERYCIRTLMPLVGLKDASILAMSLIADYRFEGADFEQFKKEVVLKHKEFLHDILK